MIEGRPSRSAQGMAMHRAAHQIFDRPLLFEDPVALPIIGSEARQALPSFRDDLAIRAFTVVRSHYAECELRRAVQSGVRQYVVLAAGLDTFACRNGAAGLRVIEVDSPATQAWKRARMHEEGIASPKSLRLAPVDFEKQTLAEGLHEAGFQSGQPAVFSFLGAAVFLQASTVMDIAKFVGGLPRQSALIFDYGIVSSALDEAQLAERARVARGLAAVGEPMVTFFDPDVLDRSLRQFGFGDIEDIGYRKMNARYFTDRTDGLRVGHNGRRLIRARIS